MPARKPTAIVGLKVRLREPLRKKLEAAAKQKGVSLNAELVARLEKSFSADETEQYIEGAMVRAFQKFTQALQESSLEPSVVEKWSQSVRGKQHRS